MAKGEQLPQITSMDEGTLLRQLNSMVDLLNRRLETSEQPAGKTPYDITGVTNGNRSTTIDITSASTAEVRAVLATLLQDLKLRGFVP